MTDESTSNSDRERDLIGRERELLNRERALRERQDLDEGDSGGEIDDPLRWAGDPQLDDGVQIDDDVRTGGDAQTGDEVEALRGEHTDRPIDELDARERELRERELELDARANDLVGRNRDDARARELDARERELEEKERRLELLVRESELAERERALRQRESTLGTRPLPDTAVQPIVAEPAPPERTPEVAPSPRGTPVLDLFIIATLMMLIGGALGYFVGPLVLGS